MLREQGHAVEAEHVRVGPLAEAVQAARTPEESDAAIETRLAQLFAVESERVANAAVLAELLLPALRASTGAEISAPSGSSGQAASPVRLSAATAGRPPPRSAETPAASAPPAPATRRTATGIADFIDEMIAQERAS